MEASGRQYFRARSKQNSYVLCHDNSKINGLDIFVKRAKELSASGLRVPNVLKYDLNKCFGIFEDIGDDSLLDQKSFYNNEELVIKSLELLNSMHSAEFQNLHTTFEMGLESHSKKFSKIFCKNFLEIEMYPEYKGLFKTLIPKLHEQQWTNCHFDFERRNIHKLGEELVLLDFQDMNFGPIGIDLAGILVDHYSELDLKVLKKYTDIFAELSIYGLSPEQTFEFTCWGALQRNLRIMGTLTSLYLRSNRSYRLIDLPQIAKNTAIVSNYLNLPELNIFITDTVVPSLQIKLSQI